MLKITDMYRWLVMAWILCGCGCMVSPVYAYDQNAQPASWGYKPVNMTIPANGPMSGNGGSFGRTYAPAFSQDVSPTFSFQSTSPYAAPSGGATSGIGVQSGPRKSSAWDAPEDEPIGVVSNPTPVGEPLVLLALALLYAGGYIAYSRKRKSSAV